MRLKHYFLAMSAVLAICLICIVALVTWHSSIYGLRPAHNARDSALFQEVERTHTESADEPMSVNLKRIYGQDLQRFAIQCPYGEPEVTARYLGVSQEELPGLRSFWQLNSETVAALILDYGDGNYETSEWDFRSIVWCPPSDLEWYTDFDVTFFERRGDPSYVPSFQAHVHAAHRDT